MDDDRHPKRVLLGTLETGKGYRGGQESDWVSRLGQDLVTTGGGVGGGSGSGFRLYYWTEEENKTGGSDEVAAYSRGQAGSGDGDGGDRGPKTVFENEKGGGGVTAAEKASPPGPQKKGNEGARRGRWEPETAVEAARAAEAALNFSAGDKVEYTGSNGETQSAVVIKAHDDDEEPYYTIITSSGREINTDDDHLRKPSPIAGPIADFVVSVWEDVDVIRQRRPSLAGPDDSDDKIIYFADHIGKHSRQYTPETNGKAENRIKQLAVKVTAELGGDLKGKTVRDIERALESAVAILNFNSSSITSVRPYEAAHHASANLVARGGYSVLERGKNLKNDEIRLMLTKIRHKQASKALSDKARQEAKFDQRQSLVEAKATKAVYMRWKMFKRNMRHAYGLAGCEEYDTAESISSDNGDGGGDDDSSNKGDSDSSSDGVSEGGGDPDSLWKRRKTNSSTTADRREPLVLDGSGYEDSEIHLMPNKQNNCWWNTMVLVFLAILQADLLPQSDVVTKWAGRYFAILRGLAPTIQRKMRSGIKVRCPNTTEVNMNCQSRASMLHNIPERPVGNLREPFRAHARR
eukprot:g15594.t1